MSTKRSLCLITAIALPLVAMQPAQAFVATVGPNGSGCDYTPNSEPLQGDAIGVALSDGATEIRLVTGGWVEDVTVSESVAFRGGYENCTDAENDVQGALFSFIAPRAGRPMTIVGDGAGGVEVAFEQFAFSGATTQGTGSGWEGGAMKIENDATVTVNRFFTDAAQATDGGAIHISGGSTLIFNEGSLAQNRAVNGGAIYCDDSTVFLGAETRLWANQATASNTADDTQGNGGGIYANECTVDVLSKPTGQTGIEENEASNHGGGIFADASSQVRVNGGVICWRAEQLGVDCGSVSAVRFSANLADADLDGAGDGGAIYAAANTDVEADAAQFSNHVAHNGGAIAMSEGRRLRTGFSGYFFNAYENCGIRPCVRFESNKANNRGGAIWADLPGEMQLRLSDFRFNTADVGVALSVNRYIGGAGIDFNNIAIAANGDLNGDTSDQGLIELNGIIHSTGSGDSFVISALTVDQNLVGTAVFVSDDGSQVNNVILQGSLIQNLDPILHPDLVGGVTGDCVVANTTLPAGIDGIGDTNVALVSTESGDYTPQANTAALDACTAAQMPDSASDTDLRNGERPIIQRVFTMTPYDAGAVERPVLVQTIFSDRFVSNL
jgi:predicted outer membrane repeat protein